MKYYRRKFYNRKNIDYFYYSIGEKGLYSFYNNTWNNLDVPLLFMNTINEISIIDLLLVSIPENNLEK